jgi:predicted DNA-binding transcriptional regulator YafY
MQLRRQVYVANRIKTKNESIYYNIDTIHTAILRNCRITFQYYDWTPEKKKKLRHDGARYEVSPWALTWDDENYYLIAYDSAVCDIRHFRVDKMLKISLTDLRRDGKEKFNDFDMAIYSKQVFGMFGGHPETVTLLCESSLAGVIIDRFGEDVTILPQDGADSFTASVKVVVSPMFLSWIVGFGGRIKITSPETVKDEYKKLLLSALGE